MFRDVVVRTVGETQSGTHSETQTNGVPGCKAGNFHLWYEEGDIPETCTLTKKMDLVRRVGWVEENRSRK